VAAADPLERSGSSGPDRPPYAAAGSGGIRERWLVWKARLLASPTFHRLATVLPFTRPVARREARALFDLCAGFVYTQVLRACVELRLPELLAARPRSVTELQTLLDLSPDATRRLLVAAESLRLVVRTGRDRDRVVLGDLGAALLANPGAVAMIHHHAVLYQDLADPVALLRGETDTTALRRYWDYAGAESAAQAPAAILEPSAAAGPAPTSPPPSADDYTTLMAASQQLVADEVLGAWDFSRHRHVMDVGGGSGNFCLSAAARHPHLRFTLFDLPPIAARARERFNELGLSSRLDAVGGSFLDDALPDVGADLITLVRIVHDHDDDAAERLLKNVHRRLPPDGALLIAEPMAGTAGAEPMGGAYFGFYLLAMGQGRPRTAAELTDMLKRCGFRRVRKLRTRIPLLTRALVAKP
jgi:demethylspheroidene O-methyltransferase